MSRRQLYAELFVNGVLPFALFYYLKNYQDLSDYLALLWATVIPGLAVVVGLVRQKKLDPVALVTLVVLGLSIALAAATDDARLLQLRESYLSAGLGALMLISAAVGRPFLAWLTPRLAPPESQQRLLHPMMQKLLGRFTWIWGGLFTAELALKWWMVDNLSIATVLALGPVVFVALLAVGLALSLWAARTLR